jgi:hypothetical protein
MDPPDSFNASGGPSFSSVDAFHPLPGFHNAKAVTNDNSSSLSKKWKLHRTRRTIIAFVVTMSGLFSLYGLSPSSPGKHDMKKVSSQLNWRLRDGETLRHLEKSKEIWLRQDTKYQAVLEKKVSVC